MDMTKGFENQDYHIYMDNYYTTVNIMNLLYDKRIYSTGAIKKNSKNLPNKEAILNTESNAKFYENRPLAFAAWKDKKIVCMISNFYKSELITREKWRNEVKKSLEIPLMLNEYNQYMKGVDLFDQRITYFSYLHNFQKWWKYIFIYLLEMAIFNSYVVYKEIQSVKGVNHLEYKDYRLEIVQLLTGFRYREQQRKEQEELKQIPCNTAGLMRKEKAQYCHYCLSLRKYSYAQYMCTCCDRYFHEKCYNLAHHPS